MALLGLKNPITELKNSLEVFEGRLSPIPCYNMAETSGRYAQSKIIQALVV